MDLANRVKGIKPSPTLAITAKAKQMKADGLDVVGFGAGEPDFDTPDNIKQAAIKALNEGMTKYTPVPGTLEAKDAVIGKLKRDQGLEYARDEIIISCGAKHTLYNIFQALVQEGDEVIIPSPYWVSYPDQVILASATPVILETTEANEFVPTVEDLKKAITPRTKALVINSPCNPTGAAIPRARLEEIAEVVRGKNILVISDEIYEKEVYDGFKFFSIAQVPGMKGQTIIVNGLSKAYSMTGWRIGYAAGPKEIVAAMGKIQSQSTSNPVSFCMPATEEALKGPQDFVAMMVGEFDKRRRYIVERLNAMNGVSCFTPKGAFYVFPNFSELYGRSFKGKRIENSTDFADYLLGEAKVAVVPGIAFGADDFARLSYATSMKNIEKGLDRIEAAIADLD
ncbi:MAG: pyridoxal phosphate-dependent aminotransferase [bacterium]|nr:pyridoxal phosphate-dependent aminotransferase [bacterium]MDT8395916.1 pyridoxal phosphate-dependent aminotransferase [bacterium]